MTTILCDVTKGLIGADSCGSDGDLRLHVTKIMALPGIGIAAWAGRHSDGLGWLEWVQEGMDRVTRPTQLDQLRALLLRVDGSLTLYEERCIPILIEVPLYGIGSGRDFAMAAYRCGKTMFEALALAAEFDLYTGPPFLIYSLKDLA